MLNDVCLLHVQSKKVVTFELSQTTGADPPVSRKCSRTVLRCEAVLVWSSLLQLPDELMHTRSHKLSKVSLFIMRI